ncbi:hypothetical protein X975_21366, partial [Stegodyphus mimosarum]
RRHASSFFRYEPTFCLILNKQLRFLCENYSAVILILFRSAPDSNKCCNIMNEICFIVLKLKIRLFFESADD